jgi:hypothetical protein
MYTDSDILDLYEDLQTVGAAETPQEEGQRLIQELGIGSKRSPSEWSKLLTQKGIPHTFGTVLFIKVDVPRFRDQIIIAFSIYPLVRGQAINTGAYRPLPFEDIGNFSTNEFHVEKGIFENLHLLKVYVDGLKEQLQGFGITGEFKLDITI